LVLRRLWQQRPGSAFLIQPHHIDLSDRHVRSEVVRLLDGGFDAIITGDVLQKAAEVERELGGDYAREQLGKGAATCALLYSVSAGARDLGATEEEIRTALLRPDINPAMVSEVLGRLREQLWYLRYRDRRYYFTARPNLNKVILDFEEEIARDPERLAREFNERLRKMAGKGEGKFEVVVAPPEPAAVPDHPRPTLVILSPDVKDEREWMNQATQYAGGSIRRHKNMLVFLAPRPDGVGPVQSALRRLLALQEVTRSASFKDLDKEDRDQVNAQLKDKETELEALLLRSYTRLYRPGREGVEEVLLRQSPEALKAKTLSQFVEAALRQEGIVLDRLAPEFLVETLRGDLEQRGELPVQQVETLLTGVPGQPMVQDPQETLRQTLREGAQKGVFGIRIGDRVYLREDVPLEELKGPHVAIVPPTASPPPPPPPPARPLTLRVQTATGVLYPLLQAADKLRKVQGTVVLEVHDPTGELAKLRSELDQLLKDYGCTVEWREETT
ncbi:DUF499 domain-containing protein, partial [Thermoflexus sp.]|uniref:DUF499 domain-containing protein n=1 Tax=Thermoflexus sp. TaxID=1969742 RepID=UPI0026025DBA